MYDYAAALGLHVYNELNGEKKVVNSCNPEGYGIVKYTMPLDSPLAPLGAKSHYPHDSAQVQRTLPIYMYYFGRHI